MKAPTADRPSGDLHIAQLLVAALANGGHEPDLVSRFSSRDGRGNPHHQHRLASVGGRLASRAIRQLQNRPAHTRPQAWFTYHLYHKAPDFLGPPVTRALGIPYYLAEASSAPKHADGPWASGYAAANAAIGAAAGILVLNPDDQACLRPLVDSGKRLCSLDPFLDHKPFAAAYRERANHRTQLRRQLGINPDRTIVLAVGMMRAGDKYDSYEVLARTLTSLKTEAWDLVIVGDGPRRNNVIALFANLPAERIHTTGTVSPQDLPSIYAASDLLVWPAMREAIGMAVLEAQATGLPVVAGQTGAIPKIVAHAETGFLSTVGKTEALAAHARLLLRDQNLRNEMASAAIKKVAQRHTVERAAATMNAMFEQTATGG